MSARSKIAALAAIIAVGPNAVACEWETVGKIDNLQFTEVNGMYNAYVTVNGDTYSMPGFRAWSCYEGGTLYWNPHTGEFKC